MPAMTRSPISGGQPNRSLKTSSGSGWAYSAISSAWPMRSELKRLIR